MGTDLCDLPFKRKLTQKEKIHVKQRKDWRVRYSLFETPWQGSHVKGRNNILLEKKKKNQRQTDKQTVKFPVEVTLLFLLANMAAAMSAKNQKIFELQTPSLAKRGLVKHLSCKMFFYLASLWNRGLGHLGKGQFIRKHVVCTVHFCLLI